MNRFKKRISAVIFILIIFSSAYAQQNLGIFNIPQAVEASEAGMLRNASYLERTGDYQAALELYRELRRMNPANDNYLRGLIRCLTVLGNYEEAAGEIQSELERTPDNPGLRNQRAYLLVDLGEVCIVWGKDKEAWGEWEKAIQSAPGDPNVFRRISAVLMSKRMVDEAVEVLERGNEQLGNGVLSLDLGRCYEALMDYESATEYYLEYLQYQPKRFYNVERAIYDFPDDEKTVEAVMGVLKSSKAPGAEEILTGYLFSLGRYDESLKFKLKTASRPEDLLNFANQLTQEGEYSLALETYQAVKDRFNDPRLESTLLAGIADCHYRLNQVEEASDYFRQLTEKYPRSSQAENALFMLGKIQLENYSAPLQAEDYFERLLRQYPLGQYRYQAKLYLAEGSVVRGDLDLGGERLVGLLGELPVKTADVRPSAMLELGKVLFWKGEADSAGVVWEKVIRIYSFSAEANDALDYVLLLRKTMDKEALSAYAEAWYSLKRGDYTSAEVGFKKIWEHYSGTVLGGRAALGHSEALLKAGESIAGLAVLEAYLDLAPEAELKDEILFELGEKCNTVLKDGGKAGHFYRRLVMETPGSPLVPIARQKLQELGEDGRGEFHPGERLFSEFIG